MNERVTDSLRDAGQGLLRVGRAGDVRADVIGRDQVLAPADVLANVGHACLGAAGRVILAI